VFGGLRQIPIEQRRDDEVVTMTDRTQAGKIETVRIVPNGSPVANYAFHVTPRGPLLDWRWGPEAEIIWFARGRKVYVAQLTTGVECRTRTAEALVFSTDSIGRSKVSSGDRAN
jgi:hypothetical protein